LAFLKSAYLAFWDLGGGKNEFPSFHPNSTKKKRKMTPRVTNLSNYFLTVNLAVSFNQLKEIFSYHADTLEL
jgi:ribosomal protein S30